MTITRATFTATRRDGAVIRSTRTGFVEMGPLWVGWFVIEQTATERRTAWYLRRRAAEVAFERAVGRAEKAALRD